MLGMRETGQRLVSHSRIERLTHLEMRQLQRPLSTELPLEYVRFMHRGPTVAVDLVGYTGSLSAAGLGGPVLSRLASSEAELVRGEGESEEQLGQVMNERGRQRA
jgi:hypothetical protein